jgi:hypothetical protein
MRRIKTGIIGLMLLSLASLASGQGLTSSEGVPTGGFLPYNIDGTLSTKGCLVDLAGGNMGSGSYQGANFLMSCDTEDTSGRYMWITQNDNRDLPRTIFEVRRNGFTYGNGLSIQQTQAYNQPTFYTPYQFRYNGSIGWAALNATTDVPSVDFPVLGIWGMVSQYGDTKPPLALYYGQTTANGNGWVQGTLVYKLSDNGHIHLGGAYPSGSLSVSTCGTGSPTIAGADTAFVITLGTSTPTSCTVTFNATWTSTDLTCTFISESDLVNWKFTKVGSANAWTGVTITASGPLTNGSKIHGVCVGHV